MLFEKKKETAVDISGLKDMSGSDRFMLTYTIYYSSIIYR
nr:MAG TPA: hypothetical protein [Bacteriophage sp.]